MDSIYLDHNATTPCRQEVIDSLARAWRDFSANPASQHWPGQLARRALDDARERIAEILGARLAGPQPDRLIFTSGGTEANNLAILGVAQHFHRATPGHLVISAVEHASIVGPAEHLLDQGWNVEALGVDGQGVVRIDRLDGLLRPDTRLVSVILGNHETGVLEPLPEISAHCGQRNIPVHTDAIQVVGKLPIDFRALGVGALSIAAHKFQGPLGIGALLLRHDFPLDPILFGGAQQSGLRPGTESVALAVGMRTALELWQAEHDHHAQRLTALRDRFEDGLRRTVPGLVVNGAGAPRLPNTSNLAFPGIDGQILLLALDQAGVACSAGSACSSGSTEVSPTLRAMNLSHDVLASSLRFSLGATTTDADIDEAIRRIADVCRRVRV
jgi:cysteine desulfurase